MAVLVYVRARDRNGNITGQPPNNGLHTDAPLRAFANVLFGKPCFFLEYGFSSSAICAGEAGVGLPCNAVKGEKMLSPSRPNWIRFRFLFTFFVIFVLSSCSPETKPTSSFCVVDMARHVTINVVDVEQKVVFNQLADDPDCAITVRANVRQHITLHMEDATVSDILTAVREQIGCKYTFDGQHLTISRLNFMDKFFMQQQVNQNEWRSKFDIQMPQGMYFEDATVSSVLGKISEVSGLEISAWEGESEQTVTVDISGMTVDEALTAVILQIENSEGVVLVKWWDGHSIAQHRLVDR